MVIAASENRRADKGGGNWPLGQGASHRRHASWLQVPHQLAVGYAVRAGRPSKRCEFDSTAADSAGQQRGSVILHPAIHAAPGSFCSTARGVRTTGPPAQWVCALID